MSVITLYQMGIITHLPEPPLPYLDADKVDASAEAYARLATPDGALGLASYAGMVVLAAMGGPERMHSRPWMPLALAAKVLSFDTPIAAKLTVDQWTTHRAFCMYCLIASAATFASVPLAALELRDALRAPRGASRRATSFGDWLGDLAGRETA